MTESLDRELELVKLQIAVEALLAGVQINIPLYFASVIVLFVSWIAASMQYPSFKDTLLYSVIFGLILLFAFFTWRVWWKYGDGIRKLDGYIEDFRACTPLPPLTTMCGLRNVRFYHIIMSKRDHHS